MERTKAGSQRSMTSEQVDANNSELLSNVKVEYEDEVKKIIPKPVDDDDEVYYVEDIMEQRKLRGRPYEYLIKWKNYPESDNTWEPASNFTCWEIIKNFKQRRAEQRRLYRSRMVVKSEAKKKKVRYVSINLSDSDSELKPSFKAVKVEKFQNTKVDNRDPLENSNDIGQTGDAKKVKVEDLDDSGTVTRLYGIRNSTPISEAETELNFGQVRERSKQGVPDPRYTNPIPIVFSEDEVEAAYQEMINEPMASNSKVTGAKIEVSSAGPTVACKNGFERGFFNPKIIGAARNDDGTGHIFVVRFQGQPNAESIDAEICNRECPLEVIRFYETHLLWNIDQNSMDDLRSDIPPS